METSLKLQLDVKNNAQDLQNYLLDLNNWEEEMKRKELALKNEKVQECPIPPPRNKIKRNKSENEKKYFNKSKKISAYDYSAWEKFDVEKACAEIDEEDINENKDDEHQKKEIVKNEENDNGDSDLTENKMLSLIDEAFYEKEMGNQFVKKEKWAEAIKCYTNAINLDPENAIYYANRSLCFLKLKNFKSAETDATTAIQIDKNYVKAYQRRAFARQALGQLQEAKSDYEEILKLESKNTLAKLEISKIDKKLQESSKTVEKKSFNLKDVFKNEGSKPEIKQSGTSCEKPQVSPEIANLSKTETSTSKPVSTTIKNDEKRKTEGTNSVINKKNLSLQRNNSSLEGGGDGISVLNQLTKPESNIFKPLPEWCKIIHPINVPPHKRSKRPFKRINIVFCEEDEDFNSTSEEKTECSEVCERGTEKPPTLKAKEDEDLRNERLLLEIPKTSIQFYNSWKVLKSNPEKTYSYLKKIPGKELPQIFENSLESNFFSELVALFASDELTKEPEVMYDFLLGLTKVKRFSSLTLFMSETDRRCLKKCISELAKVKSKEEIAELLSLYELKIENK